MDDAAWHGCKPVPRSLRVRVVARLARSFQGLHAPRESPHPRPLPEYRAREDTARRSGARLPVGLGWHCPYQPVAEPGFPRIPLALNGMILYDSVAHREERRP